MSVYRRELRERARSFRPLAKLAAVALIALHCRRRTAERRLAVQQIHEQGLVDGPPANASSSGSRASACLPVLLEGARQDDGRLGGVVPRVPPHIRQDPRVILPAAGRSPPASAIASRASAAAAAASSSSAARASRTSPPNLTLSTSAGSTPSR